MIFAGRLPLAPTSNLSYRTGKGKFYHSQAAKDFLADSEQALQATIVDREAIAHIRQSKEKIPLLFVMTAYLESLWMSDVDGRIKITIDAIFQYLKINDNRVVDLVVRKRLNKQDPHIEAQVYYSEMTENILELLKPLCEFF